VRTLWTRFLGFVHRQIERWKSSVAGDLCRQISESGYCSGEYQRCNVGVSVKVVMFVRNELQVSIVCIF
jgi:hypothetical protein